MSWLIGRRDVDQVNVLSGPERAELVAAEFRTNPQDRGPDVGMRSRYHVGLPLSTGRNETEAGANLVRYAQSLSSQQMPKAGFAGWTEDAARQFLAVTAEG